MLNELDAGMIRGDLSVQVTDGVTEVEALQTTIVDEVSLGSRAISTDEPIDAIRLRFRYFDAERLQSVALPKSLDLEDIAEMSLTFSTRIDAMSNRSAAQVGEVIGLVSFDVLVIQLVE
jgi:hypothetical protein